MREAGSSESIDWNMIGIRENTTNWFPDPSNQAEQWYAIDNVIVSTTQQPYDGVIDQINGSVFAHGFETEN